MMLRKRTPFRDWAAKQVAQNYRIRQRLPKITAYAVRIGLLTLQDVEQNRQHSQTY